MSSPDIPQTPDFPYQPGASGDADPHAARMAYAMNHTSIGGHLASLAARLNSLPESHREALRAELLADNPGLAGVIGVPTPEAAEVAAPVVEPAQQGEESQPQPVIAEPEGEKYSVFTAPSGGEVLISEEGVAAAQERLRQQQAKEVDHLFGPLKDLGQSGEGVAVQQQSIPDDARVPGSTAWRNSRFYGGGQPTVRQEAPTEQTSNEVLGDPLFRYMDPASWLEEGELSDPFDGDVVFPQGIGYDSTDPHASEVDSAMAGLRGRWDELRAMASAARTDGTGVVEGNERKGEAELSSFEPAPSAPVEVSELAVLGENETVTEEYARELYALDRNDAQQDRYFDVLNDLSPAQRKQYFAYRDEFNRAQNGSGEVRRSREAKRRRVIMLAAGAAAVVGAIGVFWLTRDASHAHTIASSLPSGHPSGSASPLATPSGGHGSAVASVTPSPKGASPVVTPTTGSGSSSNLLGQLHGHHGGNVVAQPPSGGDVSTQPSVEHAIQINNDFAVQHHGNTQPLWSSLHQAGFSDNQIAAAIGKAKDAGQIKEIPTGNGGYFLRLTSTNSENPADVMNVLKGFIS